jgi:hypothetical protein
VSGRATAAGTAVAPVVRARGNCGWGPGAAASVNGLPPGAVGTVHLPAGEGDLAQSGQDAVVASSRAYWHAQIIIALTSSVCRASSTSGLKRGSVAADGVNPGLDDFGGSGP